MRSSWRWYLAIHPSIHLSSHPSGSNSDPSPPLPRLKAQTREPKTRNEEEEEEEEEEEREKERKKERKGHKLKRYSPLGPPTLPYPFFPFLSFPFLVSSSAALIAVNGGVVFVIIDDGGK